MDTNQIIKVCSSLMQLDLDAVHAYDQAIKRIDEEDIRERITAFRHDHERHVEDLEQAIRGLGGEPPERSRGVKGFFLEGFTAAMGVAGSKAALRAMRTNEKLTNKKYEEALGEQLPDDVRQLVEKNREDERRHLQYIEATLDTRFEEEREEQAPPPPA
jgi:rubrerythrin